MNTWVILKISVVAFNYHNPYNQDHLSVFVSQPPTTYTAMDAMAYLYSRLSFGVDLNVTVRNSN